LTIVGDRLSSGKLVRENKRPKKKRLGPLMTERTPPQLNMVTAVGDQDGGEASTFPDPQNNEASSGTGLSNIGGQDTSGDLSTDNPVLRCSGTGRFGITRMQTIESGSKPADATVNTGFVTGDITAIGVRNGAQQSQSELIRDKKRMLTKDITDPAVLRELLVESYDNEAKLIEMIASGSSLKAPVHIPTTELICEPRPNVSMDDTSRVIEPSIHVKQPVQNTHSSFNLEIEQMRIEMAQMFQQLSGKMERMSRGNIIGPRPVEQVIPEPVQTYQAPDVNRMLVDVLRDSQKTQERANRIIQQGQYLTVMNSLPFLYGDEGPSRIAAYFRNFENITAGWDSYSKASLIASRLQNQARLLFDALGEDEQMSYERVKDSVLNGGASADSLRAKALSQLSRRLVQRDNESFLAFGKRLLSVTRDSLLPGTPEASVHDLASWHLMSYVRDPTVRGAVAAMRGQCDYHKMLDQACALIETNAASQHANRSDYTRREYDRVPVNRPVPPQHQVRYHPVPVPRNNTPLSPRPAYVPNAIPQNRSNVRVTGGNTQQINQPPNHQTRRVNVTQASDPNQDEIAREGRNFGNEFNGCSKTSLNYTLYVRIVANAYVVDCVIVVIN
jgi:hypothetical protein